MRDLTLALEEFIRQRHPNFLAMMAAKVVSVDTVNFLVDCEDGAGNLYLDVRLNATNNEFGLILVPKVGSSVLIAPLGTGEQEWLVVAAGTITDLWVNAENQMIHVGDMVSIGVDGQYENAVKGVTLNTNLNDLITAIQNLTNALSAFAATNGAASAGILAPLAPAYTTLNAALPSILSALATTASRIDTHLSQNVRLS